jgi:hypothetical protein
MSADREILGFVNQLVLWVVFLPLLLLLIPFVLVWLVISLAVSLLVLSVIWLAWPVKGKDLLVVYSDSPLWQAYFESGLLPQVRSRAEVLNWSQRSRWPRWSLARIAFNRFKKAKEYVPVVIRFSPLSWPTQVRLYRAFHDCKHGNPQNLLGLEGELSHLVGESLDLSAFHPRASV